MYLLQYYTVLYHTLLCLIHMLPHIGTPDGVGYARKPPRTLLPGDRVRIEIEGLGALENTVALTAADIGTSADLMV